MTDLRLLALGLLLLGCLGSAVVVVQLQHRSRLLFAEIHALQRQQDELELEWTRLELEQSTQATHVRIERIARERLGMRIPELDEVEVMLR